MEPTTLEIITQYYEDILQLSGTELTAADRADIASYAATVDSGALTLADARAALIASPAGEQVQDVVRLYQVVFGRVPDQAGLDFQVDATRDGFSIEGIAVGFSNSDEFEARFGGNTVNTAFINAVYQQTLGRTPAASEVQFYLDSGFSAGRIALAFAESPEFVNATQDAVEQFLESAALGTQDYEGSLVEGGLPGTPGDVFTLTAVAGAATGIDELTGTAGNDTFRAVTADSLNTADIIDGAGGTDTLNISALAIATGAAPVIHNVEIINNADAEALNLSEVSGLEQLWSNGAAGTYAYTGVEAGTVIGAANAGAKTVNVDFDGDFSGGADVISLAVDDVNGAGVTFGGADSADFEVVQLAANGDTGTTAVADLVNLVNFSAAESLTITGGGDVRVTNAAATLETLTATAATGDITINLSGATALETASFGSGDDVVTAAISDDADTTFNLGAGNDIFTINGTGDTNNSLTTVTLGAGNDTFVVATALTNIKNVAEVADGLIVVTDFSPTNDLLNLDALGPRDVLTTVELGTISQAASLSAAVTAAAAVTTLNSYSIFNYDGNAYVYNNVGATNAFDNGDGLIQLTGVAVAQLDATNLVA